MLGQALTAWTIRFSLACYVAVLAARLADAQSDTRPFPRVLWTLGCLLFLAHTACAFHFYHGWSHARAVADTARQTRDLLGWEVGAGVYFNYLFAVVWMFDAGWWWISATSYGRRPQWVSIAVQAYLFFIAINGAIVFASGATRWIGVAACVGLGVLAARRYLNSARIATE